MGQTSVEKITQAHSGKRTGARPLKAGDYVMVHPRHVMTHDNTSAVLKKFQELGASKVAFPEQPVFTLDHNIQDESEANQAKYRKVVEFAEKHGIRHYPARFGIGHQIMLEEGFVLPGSFVVASDSHSNIYGALAALGTPVVRTDAAAIWATGETWWQVPDTVLVRLTGRLQSGVTGKDVILALCWRFNRDEVLNCCVEFSGPGVRGLSISERMTIANMSTEWGTLAGVFPYDEVTEEYLLGLARRFAGRGDSLLRLTEESIRRIDPVSFSADPDAVYARKIELDLSSVSPLVTGPDEVKISRPVVELEKENIRIDKAYLLSCVNARLEDFHQAAEVVGDRKIAPHVKMYIAAASALTQKQAEELGYWGRLLRAGAIALPAGCGPCIGLGEGTLGPGETAISATNRNFKGRMGDRSAHAYLAAPAVVAASAVAGQIKSPYSGPGGELQAVISVTPGYGAGDSREETEVVEGAPESCHGRLLFLPKDNLNTDGIYGKEATYRDDLSPEQMAGYSFKNYDPLFQQIARRGDIILGGWNFGCGSSREQAATALKFFGIQIILAGSFSQTYKRNAFNNGLLCVECPELLEHLKQVYGGEQPATIVAGKEVRLEFRTSTLVFGPLSLRFTPVSRIPQELVAAGGLEPLLVRRLHGN